MKFWRAIAIAVIGLVSFGTPSTSMASAILAFSESGGNVVGELSGSIHLQDAQHGEGDYSFSYNSNYIRPDLAVISSDDGIASLFFPFDVTGPTQFGSSGTTYSNSNTMNIDFFLCRLCSGGSNSLFYTSFASNNLPLSGAMTFLGQSFSSLGLQTGTYVYTFSNSETFTLQIGTTPLPAAFPLFVTGLGALGLFGWRSKRGRKQTAAMAVA
jgi:hypothetical protein